MSRPAREDVSLDAETLQFLNSYNVMQAKIARVALDAGSLQMGYSDDVPWPLHLEMDRQEHTLLVQGGGQKCVVKENTAMAYREGGYYGAMHSNLLYMSMFWTFNPRAFSSVEVRELTRPDSNGSTQSLETRAAVSADGAALCFDKQTGRLVRMTGQVLDMGTLTVDLYDFVVIDELRGIVLPTVVMVRVPDRIVRMPLPPRFERVIRLRFNPSDLHLEYASEDDHLARERRRKVRPVARANGVSSLGCPP